MKINLSKIRSKIIQVLKQYPMEALVGFLFFILFCVEDHMDYKVDFRRNVQNVLVLFPVFCVWVYSFHQFFFNNSKRRVIYYLTILFPLPFLWMNLDNFVYTIGYGFTLLLAFFVLLACKCKWNNPAFAGNCVRTFVSLIVSMFIGHVLFLVVWAIFASVAYIFNFQHWNFPEYAYMFSLFVIIPLLFCHFCDDEREEKTTPRFWEIIINYILSPGVIVYTAVLYLYFIVITAHWELPKGGIGYMVLAFIIAAMAGRMSQLIVNKNYYDWFYKYFSWIAIPPLLLFWIGTLERIFTYSFTESRVYLLASGVLMTLYMFFLLSKKMGNYQLMAVITSICIVILTYIPGISAKSIGIRSQKHRLEKYISHLDMRDSITSKLKKGVVFSEKDSLRWNEGKELRACYDYLSEELGTDYMLNKYGKCDIVVKNRWHYLSPSFRNGIDIEGYRYYFKLEREDSKYKVTNDKGKVTILRMADDKVIMNFDVNVTLNEYRDYLSDKQLPDSIQMKLFVSNNDSCMVILNSISYEDGVKSVCNYVDIDAFLIK